MKHTPLSDVTSPPPRDFDMIRAAREIAYSFQAALPIEPLKPGERMPKEMGPELEIPAEAPPDVLQLKQKQRNVLELLVEGLGITEAARLSDVGRTTVHRWIRDDKDFAAALAQWRQRTHESARNKLISAADGAANVLLNRLRHGDLRAAIAILRSNGLLTPMPREQTDKPVE